MRREIYSYLQGEGEGEGGGNNSCSVLQAIIHLEHKITIPQSMRRSLKAHRNRKRQPTFAVIGPGRDSERENSSKNIKSRSALINSLIVHWCIA